MTLNEKQLIFPVLLGKLLTFAADNFISLKMGETWRTPEQAKLNAKKGVGIVNSLHIDRIAVDLLVFKLLAGKWVWLKVGNEPEYRRLGLFWKSLHPDCAWGGDWKKPDPGHFSIRHGGRE